MDSILKIFRGTVSIEHCLRRAVEESTEGIVIINLDGTIRYANAALAAMHGYYTGEELVGRGLEILHNEAQMRTDVVPLMDEAKCRGRIAGPVEHIRSDGTSFPTQTRMVAITDRKGKCSGLAVFVMDMSECRPAEQSLVGENVKLTKASEQLLATSYELTQEQASMAARISVLLTANEQLQRGICECRQTIEQLNQYRDWLEQQTEQQCDRLSAADKQLQQKVTECSQADEKLQDCYNQLGQFKAELSAVRGQVQPSDGAEKGVVLQWDAWDKQVKEAPQENEDSPKSIAKPRKKRQRAKSSNKPLNTEQLREIAEIGKRVARKQRAANCS